MPSPFRLHQHKLKKEHLKAFDWWVRKWMEYYALHLRWETHVLWTTQEDDDTSKWATVTYSDGSCIACFQLSRHPKTAARKLTDAMMAEIALHEVAHVLLAPLSLVAEENQRKSDNINGVEHHIVHTLVRLGMRAAFDDFAESCPHL